MTWRFWKRRRPVSMASFPPSDLNPSEPEAVIYPTLDEQADKLAREAMEGIGRSLRLSAEIRQTLADGALELRINRK